MNDPNFELIFPTPVMFNSIERNFTKDELKYMHNHDTKTYQNVGNTVSLNNYILNEPELKHLKHFVQSQIEIYVAKVYKPRYPVKPYITQSWLNWTKKDEYHHKHEHPNSFISGVLYINADFKEDKIRFHKSGYQQIKLVTDNHDVFNSESWWFSVKTGDIVIFPSSLTHNVEPVTANETRISLAFNTFLKGTIGDNRNLTELKND